MTSPRKRLARPHALHFVVLVLGASVVGCAGPESPDPLQPDQAAATTGVTVTAASPSASVRDTTLDVQISGTGFDRGSQVVFTLQGVSDPRVRVNLTKYSKSSLLVANLTIAAEAVPSKYDIQVTTSAGKKGIGTELFAILAINAVPSASIARAINAAGEVVGRYTSAQGYMRPFIWSGAGPVTDLPVLPTDNVGEAVAVNASSVIAGYSGTQGHSPVKWVPSGTGTWVIQALEGLTGGSTYVGDVNAVGRIAGAVYPATGATRAVFWNAERQLVYLAPLSACAGGSTAFGINDLGDVVGYSTGSGSSACNQLPVIWSAGGAPVALPLIPGYDGGRALSISGSDFIVGSLDNSASPSTTTRAVLWRGDPNTPGAWLSPILLGSLGGSSRAQRVDAAGRVVGFSRTGSGTSADQVGFYWDATVGMKALPVWAKGWEASALGIVGPGTTGGSRVVGYSYSSSGKSVGVWWPMP